MRSTKMVSRWLCVCAAVVLLPLTAAAQGVATADAGAFLGNWALELEGPMGPISLSLSVMDEGGKVAAKAEAAEFGVGKISDISKKENSLTMKFELDVMGMLVPAAIILTPDGTSGKVVFDVADGQFTIDGTATKK